MTGEKMMKKVNGVHDRVATRADLERQADQLASKVGANTRVEAFRRVDRGEFAGTIVEAELKMLRSMLKT